MTSSIDQNIDRVHRLPRVWSNQELKKFAHLFSGSVVNVSGWKDIDKQGQHYRDYFTNADSYEITNYKAEARGFQGYDNEIFLDLEAPVADELIQRYDVVFNHTTLEHVYEVTTAFENLCKLTKDAVILVVPFLQQYHTDYGDYWRFTPLALQRLFKDNGLELLYQSFNTDEMSSVYLFAIASKHPEKWSEHFDWSFSVVDPQGQGSEPYVGCQALPNFKNRYSRSLIKLAYWLEHRR